MDLYMHSSKWNDTDFLEFVYTLNEYGNTEAYKIFTTKGAPVFLLEEETATLERENVKITESGCYEGISMEDEINAQSVLNYMKDKRIIEGGRFILDQSLDWNQLVPTIKSFTAALTAKRLWFNPWKPQLPLHYIERKCFEKTSNRSTYNILHTVYDEDKKDEERLVLIVDAPGMGKSCVLTELENDLRQKLKDKLRLILRINLNLVIQQLFDTDPKDFSLPFFLKKYASFIPPVELIVTKQYVPAFIFLDGLDEVCPRYKEVMLNIIHNLLSEENKCSSNGKLFFVETVVVTTRPHLKDLIEKEFKVSAYCLLPLNFEEQVDFMFKIQNGTFEKSQVEEVLQTVQITDKDEDLMGNPLMLTLYSECLTIGSQVHDKFSLYSRFMDKRHMNFLTTKKNMSLADPFIEFELKSKIESSIKFYYFLSVQELIDPDDAEQIALIDREFGTNIKLATPTLEHEISLLLSYGVVVKSSSDNNELRFSHKSFAEFFYAKLLTDIKETSQDLRNVLFAVGYKYWENTADFVSCKLKADATIIPQMISTGWAQYVPDCSHDDYHTPSPLELYLSDGNEVDNFTNHIFSDTLDYKECKATRRMLVLSCHALPEDDSVFLNWIRTQVSKGEEGIQFLRNNVFQVKGDQVTKNMQEVVVAISTNWDYCILSSFLSDTEVKLSLLNCPVTLKIAVKWKYFEIFFEDEELYVNHVLARLRRWLSDVEIVNLIKVEIQKCIDRPQKQGEWKKRLCQWLTTDVLFDPNMCWIVAEHLPKESLIHLIKDEPKANTNGFYHEKLRRCFGVNFLSFSGKFFEGNIFKSHIPNEVIDNYLWREIEENPDLVILRLKEDSSFELVKALEASLVRAQIWQECEKRKVVLSKSDGHFKTLYLKRKYLFKKLVQNLETVEIARQYNWCSVAFGLVYNRQGQQKNVDCQIVHPFKFVFMYGYSEFFYAANCLILSAQPVPDSDEYKLLQLNIRNGIESEYRPEKERPFSLILLAASAQELTLEMKSMSDPSESDKIMVSEVPVWDVLMELIVKSKSCNPKTGVKITQGQWCFLVEEILDSQCHNRCYSQGNILHQLKDAISDDQLLKSVLLDSDIMSLVALLIRKCWKICYSCLTFPPTECPCLSIVSFYIDTFTDDERPLEWMQRYNLLKEVPVEILVAAQHKSKTVGCETVLPDVQRTLGLLARYPCQLWDIHKYWWTYKRECEWMILLRCFGFPELPNCDPIETERVHSHYLSALLSDG